jgi:hypothetical protein
MIAVITSIYFFRSGNCLIHSLTSFIKPF